MERRDFERQQYLEKQRQEMKIASEQKRIEKEFMIAQAKAKEEEILRKKREEAEMKDKQA